jgi:hypothetical protein
LSSDETFEFVSRIDWTYSITGNSVHILNKQVTSTFNEISGYKKPPDVEILNQNLIDYLRDNNFISSVQKDLLIILNALEYPITYRWYIYEMQVYPKAGVYENFVTKIIWRYNGVNSLNLESNVEGMTTYNNFDEDEYVNYDNLTESQIMNWLENQDNIGNLKFKIERDIYDKMNPTVITLPLPW